MPPYSRQRLNQALWVVLIGAICSTAVFAEKLTIFEVPGFVSVQPVAINNRGDVVGVGELTNGGAKSFLRTRDGEIVVIDVPESLNNLVTGLNDLGQVTGAVIDTNGVHGIGVHGFIRDVNGDTTIFDAPDATQTNPMRLNDAGQVAGTFRSAIDFNFYGFLRDKYGTFTVFDVPGAQQTHPTGLNANGDITGTFVDTPGASRSRGFVRYQNGELSVFDSPIDDTDIVPFDINARGDVTGRIFGNPPSGGFAYGFIRDRRGELTVFDVPSPAYGPATHALGINAKAQIVGYTASTHCFVRDRDAGMLIFDFPNTLLVRCWGINDSGDVTGYYIDGEAPFTHHVFVRSARGKE